ncbi:gliding motility protein [Chryseobacterium indologenes]|uniref:T9SS type B sorting domain-containing protein n=1 Tax=Chryseobacterium indologenes TaxID=253 RepID=UPI000BFDAF84|nr:gliding motility-associated C-terminal domain-containing protein [Chryseobacterium indologenes]ATN06826.1 gliding motility protein [Chryseobacterium indologenes]AYY84428.1 gliding motility-associated C-terminal domain-containing protein [Chryseobacterium indologenes]QIX81383.1 T9SS type B sorting domain-containing protein [Chryseobacterium indologenes]UDQ55134.1 gliding motility-associated C-terminal domain-containing protein [Chryseobacterium indologenes]
MKRFLLSLVLVFLTINTLFAQRDTEHWIAPYYDSYGGYVNMLYLSTDSITPFDVTVYNNNAVVTTVTISKGNPQTYKLNNSQISTGTASEAFVVGTKGLYLKATKPFYCSLRLAQDIHGEIITSKGRAGIGKTFFVAASPNKNLTSIHNFTAGVLATEDNTTVTVSWNTPPVTNPVTPPVSFINGSPTGNTHTFTLQKGQSFILAGSGAQEGNREGFIGAKVVADKPVTLTNGSCNANFSFINFATGSDPVLDQSVPVDKLGNTFAMVKTRSTVPSLNMEGGLIIATEDNTEVYINGATTPIATLNAGKFYRIDETNYATQTTPGGTHSNMFISTTKNVYLYQFIGVGASDATNGFNYIPPLNCFLPRKIDEVGKINEMPLGSGGASITKSDLVVKLNILTEAGATVLVNNNPPLPSEGPFPLTGNTNWVTYGIPSVTGNITITSTKAVTAGINGGYSSAGYGGYFAGFSSIPFISKKTGECVPGIVLELDDGYETYQWFRNGTAVAGATANTYTPTQSGNYTVKITMGTCPPVTTPIYKVQTCLKLTTQAINACSAKVITPAFTSSTQSPVTSTLQILTPPTKGTAVINPNGTITYTPNPGYLGPDTIVYKFCGDNAEFTDCEQITLNLTVVPFIVKDATITACWYDVAPYAYFDLTKAKVSDYDPVTKKYYRTLADLNAGINEITTPDNFPSTGGTVYVKITTAEGCTANAKITLVPIPIKKSPVLIDQYICMDARTDLDAGPGYDSYQWSTGATTSGIRNVGVGEYSVKLGKNGCFLTQIVKVKKADDPVIQSIEINNNNATVTATGGKPPYKYAVDGTANWQDSNTFTGLTRGQHTFYIKDAYNCTPVAVEITVPNLLNAITPNGDNINDFIDYSELAYKENLTFSIYDRYGNTIFTGNKFNNFKWDGKHFDKKIVTGTYWYHITWNESNKNKTPIKYTGWILVKNRE